MTLLPTLGLPTSAMRRGWARSRISGRGARSARAWGQDICRQFASAAPARNAGNSAVSPESQKRLPDSRQPLRHRFCHLAFALAFAVWPLAFGICHLAFVCAGPDGRRCRTQRRGREGPPGPASRTNFADDLYQRYRIRAKNVFAVYGALEYPL